MGVLVPHAGYRYSGPVAAHVYYRLSQEVPPDTVVVVGPNHTGAGTAVSIEDIGVWETPLGPIGIDEDLSGAIRDEVPLVSIDYSAHRREHSVEVQIPFLQTVYGSFQLVPIVILSQDLTTARKLGDGIAEACRDRNTLVVASSDLTHYESEATAQAKDMKALEAAKSLDEDLLISTVYRHDISMCGYGPVAAVMRAAKILGASEGEILKHATSAHATGDSSQVVGYASALFRK